MNCSAEPEANGTTRERLPRRSSFWYHIKCARAQVIAMKLSVLVLAAVLGLSLVGCQKEKTELVKVNGEGTAATGSASATDSGSTDATDLATNPDTPTTNDPTVPTPAVGGGSTSTAPNPGSGSAGLGTSSGMPSLSQEGRVTCEACKGTLPREDAVTAGGKTLCMACAEEAKG